MWQRKAMSIVLRRLDRLHNDLRDDSDRIVADLAVARLFEVAGDRPVVVINFRVGACSITGCLADWFDDIAAHTRAPLDQIQQVYAHQVPRRTVRLLVRDNNGWHSDVVTPAAGRHPAAAAG